MRTAIKIIFCLAIFFAFQTKELSAQSVSNPGGTFPAPDGITLKGTAEVPMSLVKATEKYNNYYQAPYVEGWLDEKKFIVKEYGRTAFLLTHNRKDSPLRCLHFRSRLMTFTHRLTEKIIFTTKTPTENLTEACA